MASCFADVEAWLCYYVRQRKEVWAHLRDIDQDYADYAHAREFEQDRRPQSKRGLWQVDYRYKYRNLLRRPRWHPGIDGFRPTRIVDGLAFPAPRQPSTDSRDRSIQEIHARNSQLAVARAERHD